ncbi:MAG TPA: tripartite tricarboxylate transporter substrate binding protein [Burkholderiales bacterium]|jgi:tripartite-type tricarboxylate transporter receptor subunit TctC
MHTRRSALKALAVPLAAAALPLRARAQGNDYPTHAVTIVVPFAAGQSADILARLIGDNLTRMWGKPVLVDNRGGAGGAVGALSVVRSPNDGYTLLLGSSGPISVAPQMSKTAGYDPRKDMTPIINLAGLPQMMIVAAKSPYHAVKDVVDAAKRQPGKLSYGTGGIGSFAHLTMEIFKQRTGIDIVHVPYKGAAPAYTDLLAGRLDVMFDTPPAAMGFVKNGQMRFLAASTSKRFPLLPDVPTVAESGVPGFDVLGWLGLLAPAGLAPAIVRKLNQDVGRVLEEPEVKKRLAALAMAPLGGTPEDFRKFIETDYQKFGAVIQANHLSSDA